MMVETPNQIIDDQITFYKCCNKDIRSQKIDDVGQHQVLKPDRRAWPRRSGFNIKC
jgi:hypothetical protein